MNSKITNTLIALLVVCLGCLWVLGAISRPEPLESSHREPSDDLAESLYPNICGLESVECQGEAKVRVTAYEAVPEQTDDSPCHDGRLNICKMHRAGIDTCATYLYERGTSLWINGLGTCVVTGVTAPQHKDRIDWFCGERPSSTGCVVTVMGIGTTTVVEVSNTEI